MVKKYTNILIGFGCYALVALIALLPPTFVPIFISKMELYPVFGLIFAGIFFGFRAMAAKESSWAGHLVVVIGGFLLLLISYALAMSA